LRRAVVETQKTNLEGLWWSFQTGLRRDPRLKTIVQEMGLGDY